MHGALSDADGVKADLVAAQALIDRVVSPGPAAVGEAMRIE